MGLGDRSANQRRLAPARIAATEEWYKIGRDQLVPHDGYYDLRITGELWETYYYDYLQVDGRSTIRRAPRFLPTSGLSFHR